MASHRSLRRSSSASRPEIYAPASGNNPIWQDWGAPGTISRGLARFSRSEGDRRAASSELGQVPCETAADSNRFNSPGEARAIVSFEEDPAQRAIAFGNM